MEYLLLACATLFSTSKALVLKRLGRDITDRGEIYRLNSLIFLVASAVVALYALIIQNTISISLYTVILSFVFALTIVFSQLTETFAMKHGSASMTILLYSLGLVFPILYGSIFLAEPISLWQIFGMMLIFLALYFIVNPKLEGKVSLRWLTLALIASFGSGLTAIIQKIQQSSDYKNELVPFLLLAFFFASALSLSVSFFGGEEGSGSASASKLLSEWKFILFSGVSIGLLNVLNLILAGKLRAIVQFPIYNIGGMILTGIGGRIIFGEKLSKNQLIGFIIGCAAILIIGLF